MVLYRRKIHIYANFSDKIPKELTKTMEIERDLYLQRLAARERNGLIKVITGVRRCGKSYLLNNIFYRHLLEEGIDNEHIIRFAFDSADDLMLIGEDLIKIRKENKKVDPRKFMAYIRTKLIDGEMYYLLLDEVQELDAFESVLNGYLRRENIDIYVTGSNAKFLSSDIITEFSGRGDEVHLNPLSFSEFMTVWEGDKYDGLSQYMLYGGIPLVVLRKNDRDKEAALQNLFDEIYIKDILRRNKVRKPGELEALLNILSSSIGSLTNPEKLKNTFRSVMQSPITSDTVRRYIGYFKDAFLLEEANRYDVKGKAYINTLNKYYFSDTGLRNARINFRQFEQNHIMENVIYNELRMRGYSVDVGIVPYAGKGKSGSVSRQYLEVDFVCNLGSNRVYIQSAYSIPDEEKRAQEIRSFRKIDDSFKKILIVRDPVRPWYDDNGILTVNIYDFLLDTTVKGIYG